MYNTPFSIPLFYDMKDNKMLEIQSEAFSIPHWWNVDHLIRALIFIFLKKIEYVFVEKMKILQEKFKMMHKYSLSLNGGEHNILFIVIRYCFPHPKIKIINL